MSLRTRPSCWPTGWAFLLSLVSLIEKGDEYNDKSSKGYEQAQYPYDNHDGLICCHQHHLLPYVLLVNQGRSGGIPLLSWVLSVTSFYHGNLCGSMKKFYLKLLIILQPNRLSYLVIGWIIFVPQAQILIYRIKTGVSLLPLLWQLWYSWNHLIFN